MSAWGRSGDHDSPRSSNSRIAAARLVRRRACQYSSMRSARASDIRSGIVTNVSMHRMISHERPSHILHSYRSYLGRPGDGGEDAVRWWRRSVPIAINEGGRGFTLSVYRDGAVRVYLAGRVFWLWGRP